MMEFYQLLIVIIVFSVVQSIIGVGLLLFGTPTLLLVGYSYPEVLWILLPASCSLSLLQIFEGRKLIESKSYVFLFTVPALVTALILVIKLDYALDIKKIVGIFLVAIAILRLSAFPKNWARFILAKYREVAYLIIGFVHGFSNLGGAPLSVVVSATFSDRKKVNANIAFVYFVLAFSQLFILISYQSEFFSSTYLSFVLITLCIHLFLSNTYSQMIDNEKFKIFLNVVIFLFGIICLI